MRETEESDVNEGFDRRVKAAIEMPKFAERERELCSVYSERKERERERLGRARFVFGRVTCV